MRCCTACASHDNLLIPDYSEGHHVGSALRHVPLKIALLYASGQYVQNQSILKISPDCKLMFGEDGSTLIKFRIDDISKNHQGQVQDYMALTTFLFFFLFIYEK